jgi:hypothetical protein
MAKRRLSKRRLRKQFLYAIQGIAIGLNAALVLVLGTVIVIRLISGGNIGRRLPVGFAFVTVVLVVIEFWLNHIDRRPRSTRSAVYGALTELSEQDRTKTA